MDRMIKIFGPASFGMPPTQWASRAQMMTVRKDAVTALEREAWLDWRRPLIGSVALILMLGGQLLLLAIVAVALEDDRLAVLEKTTAALLAIASVAVIVGGGWLGAQVWRRGRQVINALVSWEELTDRVASDGSRVEPDQRELQDAVSDDERRLIAQRNFVYFRVRGYQPEQIPRIALAVLLALPGIAGPFAVIRDLLAQGSVSAGTLMVLGPCLTALVFAAVIFGGPQRFGNAMFRRDRTMRRLNRQLKDGKRERHERWEAKLRE